MQFRTNRGDVAIDGREAVGYQTRTRRDLYCDSRACKVKKNGWVSENLVTAFLIRTNSPSVTNAKSQGKWCYMLIRGDT
jgi:hypothetical protein